MYHVSTLDEAAREAQDLLKRLAPHDQNINGLHELTVAVILYFATALRFGVGSRQPVESTVISDDESIETGCDVDRNLRCRS